MYQEDVCACDVCGAGQVTHGVCGVVGSVTRADHVRGGEVVGSGAGEDGGWVLFFCRGCVQEVVAVLEQGSGGAYLGQDAGGGSAGAVLEGILAGDFAVESLRGRCLECRRHAGFGVAGAGRKGRLHVFV